VFALDAYHGLFRLNLTSGVALRLFSDSTPICARDSASSTRSVFFSKMKFMNDFDIDSTGCVYFTDSSYKCSRSNNRYATSHEYFTSQNIKEHLLLII
jgi:hypothetical protein